VTLTALAALNVQTARRDRLARELATATGLSLGAVRSRLARAHGRTLLRNLFADVWHVEDRARRDEAVEPLAQPRAAAGQPRTIHRVRQEFTTSCGVAVVAMFARVAHADAMKVMFPQPRRAFYTYLHDIKRALDHFGVRYAVRWHRFRSWQQIPTTSLVKVKWQVDGKIGYHWMVFQRRDNGSWNVIDPDPPRRSGTQRLSRSELEGYRGITYLPVEARRPESVRS
jgi:hypothetical protein